MIDIAIVGGGLCGLALADRLKSAGKDVHLFEARETLGGRVRTVYDKTHDIPVDLGPAWYWPDEQPLIADLIARLGLTGFPQYDTGAVLALTDPEKGVETLGTDPVHGGAHRLVGGMGQLVEALLAGVGDMPILTGHQLLALEEVGDHVRLRFKTDDGHLEVEARQVVLTLPPRLLAETVEITPPVPAALQSAMAQTETWMAAQAKAVMIYGQSGWREAGKSGNAFVHHERAVLGEVFDLSAPEGTPGALGGFLALDAVTRASFAAGMPTLVGNQLGQLFGAPYEAGALHYQDWAEETFTCSQLDKTGPIAAERAPANPLLRRALWAGKLHLAGTETAAAHAGHMEGALQSAYRLAGTLLRSATGAAPKPQVVEDMAIWFGAQTAPAFDAYRQALNRYLSGQDADGATRQAAGDSISGLFEDMLNLLGELDFGSLTIADPDTRTAILEPLKPTVRDALSRLIGEIMGFNRSSCALRNFPEEHNLPDAYVRLILQDASQLGRMFFNEADALIAARAEAA